VLSPQIAREATFAFQGVVQYGTGTGAGLYNRQVAGKTGTTNNNVDAWFNGFTPQMETTVWMGNVGGEVPMVDVGGVGQVYGGTFPAHTWQTFMSSALAGLPAVPFTPTNYALLPYPKYITSPSLVQDDVLDHNFVYTPPPAVVPPPGSTPTTSTPNSGSTPTSIPPSSVAGRGPRQ
jgi:membrane peptidoglycan carboxypeptidase